MFRHIKDSIIKSFRQETLAERGVRMMPGVLYSAMAASVYVFLFSTINVIFFPDLHLAVNWFNLLIHWIEFGIALALAGAIVGWFTEEYMGIVGGGVVLTTLLMVGNLIASLIGNGNPALAMQSLFTAIPLIGAGVLLAGAIRMAINRHLHIKQQEQPKIRQKLFYQMIFIVFLAGFIPGVFSRFDISAESAIRTLNESLQNAATDPSMEERFPIAKVPALKDHFGMDYSLYARASAFEAGALDITIHFEDGYSITCLVKTASGYATFLQVCNEGPNLIMP